MSSPQLQPTFRFITLGCKVNQYDTQAMREAVAAAGLREARDGEPADLVVVNTCTVTRTSDDKCRQQIRRAIRDNPRAKIVVAGCYVDRDRAAIEALAGVHEVLTNADKPRIAAIARDVAGVGEALGELEGPWGIGDFAGHSRAFVKIEDGCDAFCTYCIVPHVRGRVRSRPLGEVVAEVQRLSDRGFAEIVLTGIHLGAYGKDLGGKPGLAEVLREILRSTDVPRVRLSSLEAMEADDELLGVMASSARVCPHLHLPLQSGDDAVLMRMNRRYRAEQFLDRIRKIRAALDRPAITTDVLVGFPGETDAQFEHTVAVCRSAEFSRMHVFPFSPRAGTPAAELPDACAPQTIDARRHALHETAAELQAAFERRWVGESAQVLAEHRRDKQTGKLRGYTERYVSVVFAPPKTAAARLMGTLVCVRLLRSCGGFMEATLAAGAPNAARDT